MLRSIKYLAFISIAMAIAAVLFIYSGWYDIGADTRHNKLTYWALETLRDNSVAKASTDIEVPTDLATSARILRGGPDYNEMCLSCHLSPNKSETDFTKGLYPAPPDLTKKTMLGLNEQQVNQRHFWIIKHGIKASGMPSWAPEHDDQRIWDLVAFISKLPQLSPVQYQILTSRNGEESAHAH